MVDREEKLLAVYAIEREANQGSYAQGLVLIGFGITYIAVVTAYLGDHIGDGTYADVPGIVRAFAPCVAISLLSAFVINHARISLRTSRIRALEATLEVELDVSAPSIKEPSYHRRTHFIADIRSRPRPLRFFALLYYLTHASIFVVSLAFSTLCIIPGPWVTWKIVASIVYGVWFTVVAVSFLLCFLHPNFWDA